MQKIFLSSFIAICFFISQVNGQDFAPVGSFWNYGYDSHSGNFSGRETWIVKADSVINGTRIIHLTKRFEYFWNGPPGFPNGSVDIGTLEYRNDSVFMLGDSYMLLFSFNMTVGDTFTIPIARPNPMMLIVDSMSKIFLGADSLKQWHLSKYCDTSLFFENITIVENIGPIDDHFTYNQDPCRIGGGTWTFECYKTNLFSFPGQCIALQTNLESVNMKNNNVQIFPNPTDKELTIYFNNVHGNATYQFVDNLGSVILSGNTNGAKSVNVDLSSFPDGFYQAIIQNENGRSFFKIIKIK